MFTAETGLIEFVVGFAGRARGFAAGWMGRYGALLGRTLQRGTRGFKLSAETTKGHHPPSVTLKNSRGQKRPAEYGVFEIKKLLLGPEIKQKEIKLGPHTGPPKG